MITVCFTVFTAFKFIVPLWDKKSAIVHTNEELVEFKMNDKTLKII